MSQMSVTQARELLGWTQSELARRAGESVSNIRDLETGENKNPGWQLVGRVVIALRKGGLKKIDPFALFPVEEKVAA